MIQDQAVVSPPPFTRWAWRGILALFTVALVGILANQVRPKGGDTEAATPDESCLPGEAVPIMPYPHISERAAADVVYNFESSHLRPSLLCIGGTRDLPVVPSTRADGAFTRARPGRYPLSDGHTR